MFDQKLTVGIIGDLRQKCEIQIDDAPPFIPDSFGETGVFFGAQEYVENGVKEAKLCTSVAIVDYEIDGLRSKGYFSRGKWENGTDGMPRFHVWGALDIQGSTK